MATTKETIIRLEAHEKECSLRYTNIEKRLDKGDEKFDRLDEKFSKSRIFIQTDYELIVETLANCIFYDVVFSDDTNTMVFVEKSRP